MIKIDKTTTGYRTTRYILGGLAAVGAGVFAGHALSMIPLGELKKYQKVGVYVASYSLAWAAGDFGKELAKSQLDDLADSFNEIGQAVTITPVKENDANE